MEQMLLITVMKKNLKYGLRNMRFQKNEYYLIVGRFVPENNYETMIENS